MSNKWSKRKLVLPPARLAAWLTEGYQLGLNPLKLLTHQGVEARWDDVPPGEPGRDIVWVETPKRGRVGISIPKENLRGGAR